MRHWTFWEWVAYAGIFVAALIIAADTGFRLAPDVMANLPAFFHSAWWGFAPCRACGGVNNYSSAPGICLFKYS